MAPYERKERVSAFLGGRSESGGVRHKGERRGTGRGAMSSISDLDEQVGEVAGEATATIRYTWYRVAVVATYYQPFETDPF